MILPENILAKIAPADLAELQGQSHGGPNKCYMTRKQCEEGYVKKAERKIHSEFAKWLTFNQLCYVHANPTRKSSILIGWPDFTIVHQGRVLFCEFKVDGGRLSDQQKQVIGELSADGCQVYICTAELEAISLTKKFFDL